MNTQRSCRIDDPAAPKSPEAHHHGSLVTHLRLHLGCHLTCCPREKMEAGHKRWIDVLLPIVHRCHRIGDADFVDIAQAQTENTGDLARLRNQLHGTLDEVAEEFEAHVVGGLNRECLRPDRHTGSPACVREPVVCFTHAPYDCSRPNF
jgi:hypothetical protein